MSRIEEFESTNPATGEINWRGSAASNARVDAAVVLARKAQGGWARLAISKRISFLENLAGQFKANKDHLAEVISRETGKPKWESLTEVDAMIGKIPISVAAHELRCGGLAKDLPEAKGVMRFRPHGVLGVLGPFNMPGHLPNGHIVPALLAGNTVVFKPSEQTPLVGEEYAKLFAATGFPEGVINLVQGGRDVGHYLSLHEGINGILFTGSTAGGIALRQSFAAHPEKILALEMGGNNPLIVHEAENLEAAAYLIIQSAYITAGQRCSRAAIDRLPGKAGEMLVEKLAAMIGKSRIGFWNDDPQPFMGPVISAQAARKVLVEQESRIKLGAKPVVLAKLSERSEALVSPGLLDITPIRDRADVEIFGPLLQLIRVYNFDDAIAEANRTAFGLSAGLISDNAENYERFAAEIRAGVLSWNRPMTGASSHLSFGGIGLSGNHRPGGFLAADYCAYPVAAVESAGLVMPKELLPGIAT